MKRVMVMALFFVFLIMGVPSLITGQAGQTVLYLLVAAMGVGMIFYMRWFQKFARQVNALMPMITENPQQYITEMEQLLVGRRPANIRAMLTMNISAAHIEMGNPTEAKKKLMEINPGSIKGANRSVYFLNLTYTYILLGENEKAMELIRQYQKQFLTLPMGGNLPHMTAFVQVFEAMENGQWETARERMETTHTAWPDKIVGVNFDFLQARLDEHFSGKQTAEDEDRA